MTRKKWMNPLAERDQTVESENVSVGGSDSSFKAGCMAEFFSSDLLRRQSAWHARRSISSYTSAPRFPFGKIPGPPQLLDERGIRIASFQALAASPDRGSNRGLDRDRAIALDRDREAVVLSIAPGRPSRVALDHWPPHWAAIEGDPIEACCKGGWTAVRLELALTITDVLTYILSYTW
jgi:hypothetical protein